MKVILNPVTLLIFGLLILSSCISSDTDISYFEDTDSEITENLENEPVDIPEELNQTVGENILLSDTSIVYLGERAIVTESSIKITRSGTYTISGTLSDGQVIIETDDSGDVNLIFDGVDITSSKSAPVYIAKAAQTNIFLSSGTQNILTDSSEYVYPDGVEDPNATLYSENNLTISGEGKLVVNANFNDGITSKDRLIIDSGNISINTVDDGIRGKNYLEINAGDISILAQGDAIKSDSEEFAQIVINGGNIDISAGDDAIKSELLLTMNDGRVTVSESYEGFEAQILNINGGTISIVSSDDSINTVDGDGPSSALAQDGDIQMNINGGSIRINTQGDGLDSNGDITMSGGELYISGPTSSGNAAIDYDGSFEISGGTLLAAGSSRMAQNVSGQSSQNSVLIGFDSIIDGGSEFRIENNLGEQIMSFSPEKVYQSIVVSTPSLEQDILYSYFIEGQKLGEFTLSSPTSTFGNVGRGSR